MTIGDVTNWCRKQPKIFVGWTEDQVAQSIREHVDNNTLILAIKDGDIKGVVLYKIYPDKKQIYVEQIASSEPKQVFRLFYLGLSQRADITDWQNWSITGLKDGTRFREFKVNNNLISKLSKI